MKICVISDTHVSSLQQLSKQLATNLKEADLIVHAGDFTDKNLLIELRSIGNLKAVCGNMDSSDIRNLLPSMEQFDIRGKTVAVVHGSGSRDGITERVRNMFPNQPDIIIFGHSHRPESKMLNGSLMINPGPARRSFIWLEIDEGIRVEIVEL